MSIARQFLKPLAWTLAVTALYAGIALAIAMSGGSSQAATTERIVTDRNTGLALFGFDPVAYFTENAPRPGAREHELSWGGVTWRFANEGNLQAFRADPGVYGPRFGGYDPVAVAQGLPTGGHPSIWAVHEDRLYVFHSEANRMTFAGNARAILTHADQAWPKVRADLVP
ncbi:MAG: YHS domain-containing (seleno)protein [Alphaproteobacteria bacterium]|jgi:hypothetical protein